MSIMSPNDSAVSDRQTDVEGPEQTGHAEAASHDLQAAAPVEKDDGVQNPVGSDPDQDMLSLVPSDHLDEAPNDRVELELILCVQHVLALSGMAFSPGAVRDLPELTSKTFDP